MFCFWRKPDVITVAVNIFFSAFIIIAFIGWMNRIWKQFFLSVKFEISFEISLVILWESLSINDSWWKVSFENCISRQWNWQQNCCCYQMRENILGVKRLISIILLFYWLLTSAENRTCPWSPVNCCWLMIWCEWWWLQR